MAEICIGTSAFAAAGWGTAFYSSGMKPAEYLTHYATKFDALEVESAFYRTPSVAESAAPRPLKTEGIRQSRILKAFAWAL